MRFGKCVFVYVTDLIKFDDYYLVLLKVLTSKDAKNLTVDFEEQAIVKRQLSPFRVLAELGCSELYQYAAKKVGSINPVCHKELGNYKVIYYRVLTTFLVQIQIHLDNKFQ